MVRTIFGDLSQILLIGGISLQELLENFKKVIRCCADYNVILSAGKFGMREAPFFVYIIGNGCYRVNPVRQAAISQIAFPEYKKARQTLLGMCLFVSPFIPDYSHKTARLNGLLHKDVEWSRNHDWEA